MVNDDVTGIRKAAIMILTMDKDLAKEILKEFDEDEIEAIGKEIAGIKIVSKDTIDQVHTEFGKRLVRESEYISDGHAKFKALVKETLGNDRAEALLDNIGSRSGLPGEFLKTCDPKVLANLIRTEHPQTIALILSTLPVKKVCDAIVALPDKIQDDVVMRIASLEKVDRTVIEDIESVLREQLESISFAEGSRQMGGVEAVANIMNQLDRSMESAIMERIEENNPELADKIRQLMFTFEDLLDVDDRSIQSFLKEISSEDLILALKGASEALKNKIFRNMSERAASMLQEDLDAKGPVKVSDVERAQIAIAMTAKKLESEGKISLAKGGDKYV